jgi:catechol 2,3-dioxygenase-like lactoylglutathione lyase family enzyme
MISHVSRITIIVKDQSDALRFYTEQLGFEKRADRPIGPAQRWITVAPPHDQALEIVLQPIDWFEGEERERKLAQVGQNPTLVLAVEDCWQTSATLAARGVAFEEPPARQAWGGVQAVAKDLYGNSLVLVEYSPNGG